jgi:hypothetical protein
VSFWSRSGRISLAGEGSAVYKEGQREMVIVVATPVAVRDDAVG